MVGEESWGKSVQNSNLGDPEPEKGRMAEGKSNRRPGASLAVVKIMNCMLNLKGSHCIFKGNY